MFCIYAVLRPCAHASQPLETGARDEESSTADDLLVLVKNSVWTVLACVCVCFCDFPKV